MKKKKIPSGQKKGKLQNQKIGKPTLQQLVKLRGLNQLWVKFLLLLFFYKSLDLPMPFFTKIVIDEVLPFKIENIMPILAMGILFFIFFESLLSYIRSILVIHLRVKLDSNIMTKLFEHLLSLPYSFFQLRASGDLVSRLASNNVVRELFTSRIITTILDGSLVIVYLVVLLWYAPFFGLITLFIGLLQVLIVVATNKRAKSLLQEKLVADANVESYQIEAIKGIASLKASGTELNAYSIWRNLFTNQLNISISKDHFFTTIQVIKSAIEKLTPLLLLWIGAYYVFNNSMSLGSMLAINALALAFLRPLTSLANTGQKLQEGLAHLDRVMKIINAEPEQLNSPNLISPIIKGQVEFKNIYFRYDKNESFLLKGISLKIQPGKSVAIVGKTGSGKSTLGNLLLGLFVPEKGQILFDDIPMNQLNLYTLRNQFGVVLQESFLFSGFIRQNIVFNNPESSIDEVITACKYAAIHDEILKMPMQYETIISEGGLSLSGGQRQRLAIARALITKPKILFLDEATSHLDAYTENIIKENLEKLDCTKIIIAHRLSTIINADKIIVIDDGKIVEQGEHSKLINMDGIYANLQQS